MKKKIKSIVSLLIALTMIFSSLTVGIIGAAATETTQTVTEGVLTFTIENGEAALTDCDQSASGEIIVPAKINDIPVTSVGNYAFSYCADITSISFASGSTVEVIGEYVFNNCGATQVTLPASLKEIEDYAFWKSSVTQLTIPASVSVIGERAFYNCPSLESISVASGNEYFVSVDGVLFNKDKSILMAYPSAKSGTSYTIPEGTKEIARYAFGYNSTLSNVTFADSIELVNRYAFYHAAVSSVTIGENSKLEKIDNYAFEGCSNLATVTFPESLTFVGDGAFYNTALKSLIIPDTLASIGQRAFYCTSLETVKIGNTPASFSDSMQGWANLKSVSIDAENPNYTAKDNVIFNKDQTILIKYCAGSEAESYAVPASVTAISDSAFQYSSNLVNVSLPEGLENIGNYAFYESASLSKIVIPESVKVIGTYAFYNCETLESIEIKGTPTEIGSSAFSYTAFYNNEANWENGILYIGKNLISCNRYSENLTEKVEIKPGMVTVAEDAFSNCDTITEVVIPESVKYINEYAFSSCDALEKITVNGNTAIETYRNAFQYTAYFNNTENWENNVLYIGNILVSSNENLSGELKIKEGTRSIASGALTSSSSITSVVIPASLETSSIDEIQLSSLESITVAEGNPSYSSENGVLYDAEKTVLLLYPAANTQTDFVIPETVVKVSEGALQGTSIQNITISKNVADLGVSPFYLCVKLKSITVDESNAYYSSDEYGVLYNKDKTTLIAYPVANREIFYKLPESVTKIGDTSVTGIFVEEIDETSLNIFGNVLYDTLALMFASLSGQITPDMIASETTGFSGIIMHMSGNQLQDYISQWGTTFSYVYFWGIEKLCSDAPQDLIDELNGRVNELRQEFYVSYEEYEAELEELKATASTEEDYAAIEWITNVLNCARKYADSIVVFEKCSGNHESSGAHTHSYKSTVTVEATETTEGIMTRTCEECGDSYTVIIPVTNSEKVTDLSTGITLEYPKNTYSGEVNIVVEEETTGIAYTLINEKTGSTECVVFDITMTVDGVEVQPDGKVTVKIPVPEGYNADYSYVYHVNPGSSSLQYIPARYVDGCLVFETDHFSYYAVVQVEPNISIKQDSIGMNYKASEKLEVSTNAAKVIYTSSDTSVATVDENGNISAVGTGSATITATVEGTDISDTCEVTVSYAWWQWIIRILLLGFLWY